MKADGARPEGGDANGRLPPFWRVRRWLVVRAVFFAMGLVAVFTVGVAVGLEIRPAAVHTGGGSGGTALRSGAGGDGAVVSEPVALPMWANDRLVPVWTAAGKPRYLDASQAPVLLFAATDPASVRGTLTRIGRRPVQLVAAAFPRASLAVAEVLIGRLEAGALAGRTVYALQGPFTTYTGHLPALVYQDVWAKTGRTVGARGLGLGALRTIYSRTLAAVGTGGG